MKTDLRKKSGIAYLACFLAVICSVAVALMATAKIMTDPAIADAQKEQTQLALKMVLPEFDAISAEDSNGTTIYTAMKDGEICGYAVLMQGSGYGGAMEGLVGFNPDLTINTYLITRQNETPGIGSKVTMRTKVKTISSIFQEKSDDTLPPNTVLDSFKGKKAKLRRDKQTGEPYTFMTGATVSNFATKDLQPTVLTGATISSKAVGDIAWRASNALNLYWEGKKK